MTGRTIAHYEILEKLGEGGMGVVYKAKDTHLDRLVAIKVLPPQKMTDPERKRRFVQEAKAASALNHPNIIIIHDIDQTDGIDFISMEYVAGKTLDRLIPRHGMRLNEALECAVQIADALARAHSAGVIHRDLKPSNIMVDEHGTVKVLDFGLAKLTEVTLPGEDASTRTMKPVTEEGKIVGTVAYMSPEQAEGRIVDARSDIFSFGSVLYEMVTGRRAFHGDSKLSTLSAILKEDPKAVSGITPDVPRDLEKIISHCLRKDAQRRFQHMADVKTLLDELKEESDSGRLTAALPATRRPSRSWLALGLGAALVLLAGAGGWLWWHSKPAKTMVRPLTRLTYNGASVYPSISPDGKLLAYQSTIGGPNPDIWIQQIGGGKAIQITHEKEGAFYPAFSPDGTQIAYQSHGGIYEVTALGGDVRLITNDGFWPRYAPEGSAIVFLRVIEASAHLFTVPRMGGTPVAIQPEVRFFSSPIVSPDGSKLLARAYRDGRQEEDLKRWWIISIPDGKLEEAAPPPLLPGETSASAPYPLAWTMPDKNSRRQWVIFGRTTGDTYNLFRVAISSDRNLVSEPQQLTFTTGLSADPSVSESGRMVFESGTATTSLWSIPIDTNSARVTGDRQSLTQVEGVSNKYPSLSRDGTKVAFFSGRRLVVKDLLTGRETQLAQDVEVQSGTPPTISPDGAFVAYYLVNRTGTEYDIYSISTAGGSPRLVCRACGTPEGFSAGGARLLTQKGFGAGFDQIALVDVATGKVAIVLADSQHHLWNPYYSWDDKWMEFTMQIDAVGEHYRIYVTPVENFVPAGPDRWIQLTSGEYKDDQSQFSPDGNTIYFTSNRDGYTCLWTLRLDPKTKRPLGAPFPIQHFHGSQRLYSGISSSNSMVVSVASDKIVTNLAEYHSDIWMMELESGK